MKLLKLLAITFILTVISACSTTPIEPPKVSAQKATEQELREYRNAELNYRNHKNAFALKKFIAFIQKHPRNSLTDHAAFYAGQIYYDGGDTFRAARYWLYIVDSPTQSAFYDQALVGAAAAQAQMGHGDEALKLLNHFRVTSQTDKTVTARAYELSAKLKLQKSDALGALQDLLIASDYRTGFDKTNLLNRVTDIINENLTQIQLDDALKNSNLARFESLLRFRRGQLLYDQKSWAAAKDEFAGIISKFPQSDQAKAAQEYLNSLDAQERSDPTVIGVVLPLTGKYSQMGYKTLRGIQMGLGLFSKSPSPIKLAIVDSEGNADVARRGVQRLVTEDHVVVIIGDILSKTAMAVASKAQELGVPCIALAQKQELGEIGDFIFRNTLTPEMQMRSLVEVSIHEKGYKRFAILYPNDSYGVEYASLFWDNVLAQGGEITAAQTYQPDETDFRDAVQRLVGTYYAEEDRGKELALRIQAWQKEQIQNNVPKSQRDKPPKDLLPPVIDFDAVFIPDDPKAVGQIGAMLVYEDVDKTPLLGTNLWDTPQIINRGGKFVENSLFIDDYFSSDSSSALKKFTSDFQEQFNYTPDVFEAQGYDSALVAFQALKSSGFNISRSTLKDKLAQASIPMGATGPLRMTPQREIEKSLVPLTVLNGKIVKLEIGGAAPQ